MPRLAYVATSGEGESEQLHFIAPDSDSPILGVVRAFDRFLDMSVGDTDSRHKEVLLVAIATLPSGCTAVTLSRGVVDHGIFTFDVNNGKYFPFEGIPVDDDGTLSLRFPNDMKRPQEDMLRSLNDVIVHMRCTMLSE